MQSTAQHYCNGHFVVLCCAVHLDHLLRPKPVGCPCLGCQPITRALTHTCAAPYTRTTRAAARRYEARSGDVEGESPLEDLYYHSTGDEEFMSGEEFDACLREWGHNRLEVAFYHSLFDGMASPPEEDPESAPVIDYPVFAQLVMTEPPRSLRLAHAASAPSPLPSEVAAAKGAAGAGAGASGKAGGQAAAGKSAKGGKG